MKLRLVPAAALAVLSLSVPFAPNQSSSAYQDYVYANLQKSRDALLDQRRELQRAYDDTGKQIDVLQQKLQRIDNYLKQVDKALRDVDDALKGR